MADNMITLTDADFETQVLKSEKLTLVDFWAAWCGPCRALGVVLEDVAKTHEKQVKVGKMNVDEQPNTPAKYGVTTIPTLLLVKNGAVVDQIIGLVPKARIEEAIAKHA
ncbi:MAG: thioredoxin [Deltaproteobacteria bacterium]|nr:MAG: thioredoxin [Deltaproteobacteria bacterium]